MGSDTTPMNYPSYVIALPPFSETDDGRLIIAEANFYAIATTDGTPFLLLFKRASLLERFLQEVDLGDEPQSVPIANFSQLKCDTDN